MDRVGERRARLRNARLTPGVGQGGCCGAGAPEKGGGRRVLLPGFDRDVRLAPAIVMRRAGGVLQRQAPGDRAMKNGNCPNPSYTEGSFV